MKLRAVFLIITLTSCTFLQAQEFTTVILVRHAEKDLTASTNDPDLSARGKARQLELMHVLKDLPVDAIYSTPFLRTRNTVKSIAAQKGLEILDYKPLDFAAIREIISQHQGGTILFSGHSNTVPAILNELTGSVKYKVLDEGEYDNLYILVIKGEDTLVLDLNYGDSE